MTDKVLCKYFQSGCCKFGSSCRFSHDMTKLPNLVCKFYLAGYCAYGDHCRYDHVRPEWSKGNSDAAASSSSYSAPPVPKPATDSLEDQLPISRLQLGDQAAHSSSVPLPVPLGLPPGPLISAGHGQGQYGAEYAGEGKEGYWEQGGCDQEGEEGQGEGGYYDEEGCFYYEEGGEYYEESWDTSGAAGEVAANGHHDYHQQQPWQRGGHAGSRFEPAAWQQVAAAGAAGAGGGELLEEEDGRAAEAATAVPLAQRSLCMQYLLGGSCSKGDACNLVHGDLCEHCHRRALHPHDPAAAAQHAQECRLRHERLQARARSSEVECGICLERVLEKLEPRERKFGLMACEHAFCLGCIRNWRQKIDGPADIDSALRTCPVCRTATHFIVPSTVWPAIPEEKDLIVNGYKAKLSTLDCKHFAFGDGTCPFGTSCFYRHAYPDGQLAEPCLRKAAVDEGEVRVLQPVRLSDFLAASSAGQQLLAGGRVGRGRR